MEVPKGKDACLVCHRALDARPGSFAQIDWKKHYRFLNVKVQETPCIACHSPHEPLFLDRDIADARRHPMIHRCRDCHLGRSDETMEKPEGHPHIFECSYCHSEVVSDFEEREHESVACTTCHLFVKDSEFAGRIIRDADPRFCLLCHGEASFRGDDGPPTISWPDQHLEDIDADDADREKTCIDCHRDKIHAPKAGGKDD